MQAYNIRSSFASSAIHSSSSIPTECKLLGHFHNIKQNGSMEMMEMTANCMLLSVAKQNLPHNVAPPQAPPSAPTKNSSSSSSRRRRGRMQHFLDTESHSLSSKLEVGLLTIRDP
jgi:hypothetical protein